MGFFAERTFDMSSFGWDGCTFTFKAVTFGQQRELDALRLKWQTATDKEDIEKAAVEILEIMKKQFVRGQALDENRNKVDVKIEDFEEKIPFDVFLKLEELVVSGEVDEAFLAKSMKSSKTGQS